MAYELTTHFSFDDGETEHDIVVTFDYTRGYPEQGPSYSSGGEPACAPEVDYGDITVDGIPATTAQADAIMNSDRIYEKCCEWAQDDIEDGRERAAEARADARRDAKWDD